VFLLPIIGVPFIYYAAKKSSKLAGSIIAGTALVNILLVLSTLPTVFTDPAHTYIEGYTWVPQINSEFTLFTDGVSASIAIVSLILILAAAIFSINYMEGKKNLPAYYALLSLTSVGLVGVFITSNLILFFFCWELMLVPAYFIIGGWGYRNSYRAAFKLFIFTHAGAVFVLLGIGAIYWATGGITDMTQAQAALMNVPDIAKWILLAMTAGFAVKMAIVPVHMWLPDAHSEAPATMSALLSGVIISAGAYAILRVSLWTVFPAVSASDPGFASVFVHGLAVFGVVSAFFGSFIALVETDIKRIIAYSSISHMGYVLFGLSLFPIAVSSGNTLVAIVAASTALTGTVLHIINHAFSKGLFFLSAGAVMHQTEVRDIDEMGGLLGKMSFTGVSSAVAALSIAGSPPFACFWSEFFIFVGAFSIISIDGFFTIPTILMLIATIISLAYSLRFIWRVYLSPSRAKPTVTTTPNAEPTVPAEEKKTLHGVSNSMKLSMGILLAFVVLIGVYPNSFLNLIHALGY
jgi:proton-translocating NADH-quinone oxidoreductase chain M